MGRTKLEYYQTQINCRGIINGGRWKNLRKKSKFGQKLHEIKRIRGDFGKSQKCFFKNRSLAWGAGIIVEILGKKSALNEREQH